MFRKVDFEIKYSATRVTFPLEFLMEEFKSVVAENMGLKIDINQKI